MDFIDAIAHQELGERQTDLIATSQPGNNEMLRKHLSDYKSILILKNDVPLNSVIKDQQAVVIDLELDGLQVCVVDLRDRLSNKQDEPLYFEFL